MELQNNSTESELKRVQSWKTRFREDTGFSFVDENADAVKIKRGYIKT